MQNGGEAGILKCWRIPHTKTVPNVVARRVPRLFMVAIFYKSERGAKDYEDFLTQAVKLQLLFISH